MLTVGWWLGSSAVDTYFWSSAHLVILSSEPILSDTYGPSFQGIMVSSLALFSYCRWSVCIQLLFTLTFTTSLLLWWRSNYWLWWSSTKAVRTQPSLSGGVLTMKWCKDAVEVHCYVVISVEINGADHSRKQSIIQDIYVSLSVDLIQWCRHAFVNSPPVSIPFKHDKASHLAVSASYIIGLAKAAHNPLVWLRYYHPVVRQRQWKSHLNDWLCLSLVSESSIQTEHSS